MLRVDIFEVGVPYHGRINARVLEVTRTQIVVDVQGPQRFKRDTGRKCGSKSQWHGLVISNESLAAVEAHMAGLVVWANKEAA